MKGIICALNIIIAFSLQVLLAPVIRIFGVSPDFLLVTVVCFAILNDPFIGGMTGFFSGVLLLFHFQTQGMVDIFIYTFIGIICGFMKNRILEPDLKMPLLIALCAYLFSIFIKMFVTYFMRIQDSLDLTMFFRGLIGLIYILPIMTGLYILLRRIHKWRSFIIDDDDIPGQI